jgi:cell division protein FtsB
LSKAKRNLNSTRNGRKKSSANGNNSETRIMNINVRSKGFLMLVVLFFFILILAFFFGEGGIIEIIKARTKIDDLQKNITELEKERDGLLKEIEQLKKNPLALEKKAREKLWLMKKNEKVVVIVREDDKKKKDARK